MKKEELLCTPSLSSDANKLSQRIKDVLKYGQRKAGQANYIRYLKGERLSASRSIVAACYCCEGNAGDGVYDCQDICCPLYPWHPYKKIKIQTCDLLGSQNSAIPAKKSDVPDRLYPPNQGNSQVEGLL